jgi:quercetin dioxygenase-like cupin family protein
MYTETTLPTEEPVTGQTADESPMRVQRAFAHSPTLIQGRRTFFKYHDLGLEAASNGRIRAFDTKAIGDMLEPTGWHYHLCEMQFVYVLKGSLVIELEDGTVSTFSEGDSFFIPGGVRHNEIFISRDHEALEVSVPGKIGTVRCERPDHLPEQLTVFNGGNA